MKIDLPALDGQKRYIFEESTRVAIQTLKENLRAPVLPGQTEIDESGYSNAHLLREHEGWEPPHPDIIGAYFRNFQEHFKEYSTDKKLAELLGLSSDRRVREYKSGSRKMPFGIWRKFLVITGRAPQEIMAVLSYLG